MSTENEYPDKKKIMFTDIQETSVSKWSRTKETRKSLAFQDRSVYEAINDRIGRKVYRNGKDATPKSLGNIQITEFLDVNESPRKSLWGTARQKIHNAFEIISNLQEHSTGGHLIQNLTKYITLENITAEVRC